MVSPSIFPSSSAPSPASLGVVVVRRRRTSHPRRLLVAVLLIVSSCCCVLVSLLLPPPSACCRRFFAAGAVVVADDSNSNSNDDDPCGEAGCADDEDREEPSKQQWRRAATAAPKPPNILLILADDLGTGDIPGYWPGADNDFSQVSMPHLEAELLAKGTSFADAHSTPLCAPSRYLLLSGNYPHRGNLPGGTWKLSRPQFLQGQWSIADALRNKNNGDDRRYHTFMAGKWHLGGKIRPTGLHGPYSRMLSQTKKHDWSLPIRGGPQDTGFDSSLMTFGGIQAPPYAFFRDGILVTATPDNVRYWEQGSYRMPMGLSKIRGAGEGDKSWDSTAYDSILVDETTQFIDNHLASSRRDDPFFAYVALGAVHVPHSPPDQCPFNVFSDNNDTDTGVCEIAGTYPSNHMDMISEVDYAVGALIKMLKGRDLMSNTLVIFTSDNGGLGMPDQGSLQHGQLSSGPLRGYKGMLYEGGHRVPLIMRWDGAFPAGEKRHHLVGLNDLFATLCDVAEIPVPPQQAIDSVSFARYVSDDNATEGLREYLGTWRFKGNKRKAGEAIRKGNFKFMRDYETNNGLPKTMLFDLENDISETTDLSGQPQYAELISQMREKLQALTSKPTSEPAVQVLPQIQVVVALKGRTINKKTARRVRQYLRNVFRAHVRNKVQDCAGTKILLAKTWVQASSLPNKKKNILNVMFGGEITYAVGGVRKARTAVCLLNAFKKPKYFAAFRLRVLSGPKASKIRMLAVWSANKLLAFGQRRRK